ncbi:MAG: hypothetical protein F6K30_15810 [Cyanothece sp. SIO2G6]|nr:hypothetical protein [Cyanothece sp. SIO2G6]
MAHSNLSAVPSPSTSTVIWTVATTILCHSVVLGIPRAIAQPSIATFNSTFNPTTLPSSGPVSRPDGLDFSLASVDQSSGGTGSIAITGFSSPSSTGAASATASVGTAISAPLPPPDSLSFDLAPMSVPAPVSAPIASEALTPSLANLFVGDTQSLVAIAIGCAEGTRTPNGDKTWAFQGHTDPGNGVWNLGTFSWQHGADSPEEADQKQLARLRKQAVTLNQQAIAFGVPWGLTEQLNALDLANQSPSAALNPGGYLERLKQAHDDGLRGEEAILWARTWSYRHPSGTRWNAPGLGNTHHGIRTDQKRRMDAINQAIAASSSPVTPARPAGLSLPFEPRSASVPVPHTQASVDGTTSVSLRQQQLREENIREERIREARIREARIINQLLAVDV